MCVVGTRASKALSVACKHHGALHADTRSLELVKVAGPSIISIDDTSHALAGRRVPVVGQVAQRIVRCAVLCKDIFRELEVKQDVPVARNELN